MLSACFARVFSAYLYLLPLLYLLFKPFFLFYFFGVPVSAHRFLCLTLVC